MSVLERPRKVDTHAHYVPEFYAEALRENGHLPGPDGMPGIPNWSVESHLAFMDAHNISKAYLSISSPGVYLAPPSKTATANAVALARRVNEYGAAVKKQYPNRFGYLASLPLPDVDAAVAELDYVHDTLQPPPDGVVLMSNSMGMYLGDPALAPVYERLNSRKVTILEHPTTPCTAYWGAQFHTDGPDAATAHITPADWQAMNRPAVERQKTAPTLDFPFETARTLVDLIVAQYPTRYENLSWILPHAGGALVPTLDRILMTLSFSTNLALSTTDLKALLNRSFYFDVAGPWPVVRAIADLLPLVPVQRILWGSDTPWTPWEMASATAEQFDNHVESVFNGDKDGTAKAQQVRAGNAEALFGL